MLVMTSFQSQVQFWPGPVPLSWQLIKGDRAVYAYIGPYVFPYLRMSMHNTMPTSYYAYVYIYVCVCAYDPVVLDPPPIYH